jgi:4-hydroxymandelate oxidase
MVADMNALPEDIHTLADYERHAANRLLPAIWGHIQEGSGFHGAPDNDRIALDRLKLLPRRLTDLRGGSTAIELFGQHHATPILLAPVAYQQLAHPEGELATVRAATAMGIAMVLSTLSSITLEEVAHAAQDAARQLAKPALPHWFQLYAQPDREATLALVRRAEDAGYQAIAFTVDAAVKRAGFPCLPASRQPICAAFPSSSRSPRMMRSSSARRSPNMPPAGRIWPGCAPTPACPCWSRASPRPRMRAAPPTQAPMPW